MKLKNSGFNENEPEKNRRQRRWTAKTAASSALNKKNGGINGVEPEK